MASPAPAPLGTTGQGAYADTTLLERELGYRPHGSARRCCPVCCVVYVGEESAEMNEELVSVIVSLPSPLLEEDSDIIMQKLLTIVVPVFKVEGYIDKCLGSLIIDDRALMAQLEVIVVNDGTPDRSSEMSREYVKRYPETFRQIDKENGGHGSAWNIGLREAKGKYLKFLDSDDWFSNLDRLIYDLSGCDADIVFNPFNEVNSLENHIRRVDTPIPPGATNLPNYWGQENVNFWSSTYKASILKPLYPLFAEGVMYDDFILTWAPLVYGRTCVSFDYTVYNYLIGRPGQSMNASKHRKGAISYSKCFEHFEVVRTKINSIEIPSDILERIDFSIKGYASYIFAYMLYFPYKEAKKKMHYLWTHYISKNRYKSKLENRYEKMPFALFFIVELIRRKLLFR